MIEFTVKTGPYKQNTPGEDAAISSDNIGDFLAARSIADKKNEKVASNGNPGFPMSLMEADITIEELFDNMDVYLPVVEDALNDRIREEGGQYVVFLSVGQWQGLDIPTFEITEIARAGDNKDLADLLGV